VDAGLASQLRTSHKPGKFGRNRLEPGPSKRKGQLGTSNAHLKQVKQNAKKAGIGTPSISKANKVGKAWSAA
jgi:hypothetical protein